MALKKALCNADLFIAANSKPTQRDSRANTSDIINYMVSSPAILTLNNDFSFDHFAIIIDFLTNIRRSMPLHIRVKLHHKADWDSINSLLSKQLTILQDQILNLTSSDNTDPINNAPTILTDSIMNIYNNLPEKTIKQNSSISFFIQLLIKQKRKIKRAFIKTGNPFLKSALNVISKK